MSNEIRIKETKDGRKAIEIADLLEALCCWNQNENHNVELIERIMMSEHFAKAFATVIRGCSNEEFHTWHEDGSNYKSSESLKALVAEHADAAAREVIALLTERIQYLVNRLQDAKNHNKKLLEQWPDAFKKYIPQELHTYESGYITNDQVTKMIEHVKQKAAENF